MVNSRMSSLRAALGAARTQPIVGRLGTSLVVAALAVVAAAPGTASAASQGSLPASLARFSHCPVSNPRVTVCLAASVQGTFQINSTTLSTTTPATISLGLIQTQSSVTAVVPTDGTPALDTAPIPIPGGLLGIPGTGVGPLKVLATPDWSVSRRST